MTADHEAKIAEAIRRVEAGLADCLTETEREELRLLLHRWRRINTFLDGLGWIGRNLSRLAIWIGVMWGVIELFSRGQS